VFWGEFARREPQRNADGLREVLGWIASGQIRPHISRSYTLAQVPQALADMAARRVTGKVVVLPNSD